MLSSVHIQFLHLIFAELIVSMRLIFFSIFEIVPPPVVTPKLLGGGTIFPKKSLGHDRGGHAGPLV